MTDLRERGAILDEGLDLLIRIWSGEPVLHEGLHYRARGDGGPRDPTVRATPFLPPPVQRPRIPIWVAGMWPNRPPFRRAARWDGVVPIHRGIQQGQHLMPADLADVVAYVREHRSSDAPFDVTIDGHSRGDDPAHEAALARAYADAGATWWLEDVSPWPFGWRGEGPWPIEAMNARIRRGPPGTE